MSATTDETSITAAQRAIGGFTQDFETREWVMRTRPRVPSPAQIMMYTQREIAKLRTLPRGWDGSGGAPLHPALANVAFSFVMALTTREALATPQFSPSPEGGLNIVWLVAGNRLTVSLELDEIGLYGTWSDGHDALRFEQRAGEVSSDRRFQAALEDAKTFLEKISTNVQHQLLVP